MGTDHGRIRCCGDCLAGWHDIDTDSWRTDFLRLERRWCVCEDCDCTFGRTRTAAGGPGAGVPHDRLD